LPLLMVPPLIAIIILASLAILVNCRGGGKGANKSTTGHQTGDTTKETNSVSQDGNESHSGKKTPAVSSSKVDLGVQPPSIPLSGGQPSSDEKMDSGKPPKKSDRKIPVSESANKKSVSSIKTQKTTQGTHTISVSNDLLIETLDPGPDSLASTMGDPKTHHTRSTVKRSKKKKPKVVKPVKMEKT
ncbi:hypothetical protein PFISCL1PPCAC_24652, partial [Pristionchus fissidentatus]